MSGAVCFDVYDREGVGAINLDQLRSVLSCVMRTQDSAEGQESDESMDDAGKPQFTGVDELGNCDVKPPAAWHTPRPTRALAWQGYPTTVVCDSAA